MRNSELVVLKYECNVYHVSYLLLNVKPVVETKRGC